MARQNTAPVQFGREMRTDECTRMTSGRAGKVVPVTFIPLLRGDSGTGRVGIDVELAEMPKPLLNGVMAKFQAWLVPKMAFPQFTGSDEFMHSYTGHTITALGASDRVPPPFFNTLSGALKDEYQSSEFANALGLHLQGFDEVNTDIIDAYNLIQNFRMAAHSSKLGRRPYATEDLAQSTALARAFWPAGPLTAIVPDYESALVVGEMDPDVMSGQLDVRNIGFRLDPQGPENDFVNNRGNVDVGTTAWGNGLRAVEDPDNPGHANIFAELGDWGGITLSDIDKARKTKAFAQLRQAYAGNDVTGFADDDSIIATLMSGLSVPADHLKRCILLDSVTTAFGFGERFATDAGNLDQSVVQGRASASLSLNVPVVDSGGIIMVTCEVVPERVYERMSDESLAVTQPNQLPNALVDIQRDEPVDMVINRRIDMAHTEPDGLYGFEPMNYVWQRSRTAMGGIFFEDNPQSIPDERRSALWVTNPVDPDFTDDHWMCPESFPHEVFSDTEAPAFELVCRHRMVISGLTQMGDPLFENNNEMNATRGHRMSDGTFVGSGGISIGPDGSDQVYEQAIVDDDLPNTQLETTFDEDGNVIVAPPVDGSPPDNV
jgi:hypothetical protein